MLIWLSSKINISLFEANRKDSENIFGSSTELNEQSTIGDCFYVVL